MNTVTALITEQADNEICALVNKHYKTILRAIKIDSNYICNAHDRDTRDKYKRRLSELLRARNRYQQIWGDILTLDNSNSDYYEGIVRRTMSDITTTTKKGE